ncbi:MAG TPA: hypothetical protein VGQ72_00655 [Pyrinomonadaceae bacterium]|jgi:hypothetical protein|nr:hypothetical protein [Pyrinomonadaceae bacterium]
MKKLFALFALVTVVLACNLSKMRERHSSNSSSPSSSSTGSEEAEKPQPTAAQQALMASGQPASWDQQGISWTLPPKWSKGTVATETAQFSVGTEAFLIGSISTLGPDFPTEISLRGFHQGAQVRKKNGEVDELKWLELDGLKGIEFRESKPEDPDGIRRLQWMAYRKYGGQTQLVNLILSGRGANFEKHQDELYAILYSTKITH